jgi:hypothetical protein
MFKNQCFRLLIFCIFLLIQGCTYRAWYEGLQEKQRQDCYQNRSQDQNCLDSVNGVTYDQYKKEREDMIKKSP